MPHSDPWLASQGASLGVESKEKSHLPISSREISLKKSPSSKYVGHDLSHYFFVASLLLPASLFFSAFPIDHVSYHPHFGR